jgi:mannitol/fructose-specific phosphotransferase system IIA component (Ntr-type)
MALADHLTEDSIDLTVSAEKRDEVVRELLEHLVACEAISADGIGATLGAVIERELLGSTAIGNGVAVPHARVEDLDEVCIAFGFCRDGVDFKALDGQPVTQVFLVLGAKDKPEDYLDVMARITRLVQNADFRRFLSRARNAAEVLDLIREMDT